MKTALGRYGFGLAAIGFGVCALVWPAFSGWGQVQALAGLPFHEFLPYVIAAVEIVGGAAVLFPRSARAGAIALGSLNGAFALLAIPSILSHPLVYNGYGNFFEQLSFVAGAVILDACNAPARPRRFAWAAYYAFAACVVSFALEQWFYLAATASFVPKWIPFGPTFWAYATTAAFGLAAIALFTRLMPRLAARLTAAMVAAFALLVWVPAIVAGPHTLGNWTEGLETLGIAASAWMVAGFAQVAMHADRRD